MVLKQGVFALLPSKKPRRPEFTVSLANSWVNRSPAVQKDQLKATRGEKKGSFCLGLPAAISSQSNPTFHVEPWKLSQSFEIAKRSRKQQPEAKRVFPCQGLPAVPLLQDPEKEGCKRTRPSVMRKMYTRQRGQLIHPVPYWWRIPVPEEWWKITAQHSPKHWYGI